MDDDVVAPPPRSDSNRGYAPTPEQIREAAAEIRAGWTETEHRLRAGESIDPVEVSRINNVLGRGHEPHSG